MDSPVDDIRREVTGLILAGGRGKRMEGRDKGLLAWKGRPLVATILANLGSVFDHLAINANRNIDDYRRYGIPVIRDAIGGYAGPLAGIHAGMQSMSTPLLFVVPCDMPGVRRAVVGRLYNGLLDAGADVAIAAEDGHLHPVVMLLKAGLADRLQASLENGEYKVRQWVMEQNHVTVEFDPADRYFLNFNTPRELAAHEGEAGVTSGDDPSITEYHR